MTRDMAMQNSASAAAGRRRWLFVLIGLLLSIGKLVAADELSPAPPELTPGPLTPGQPMSFEELLQLAQDTSDRLEALEKQLDQTAQDEKAAAEKKAAAESTKEKKWFEKYAIRGYVQMRINEVLDDGPAAAQLVGDSSVGENQSFLIRRAD